MGGREGRGTGGRKEREAQIDGVKEEWGKRNQLGKVKQDLEDWVRKRTGNFGNIRRGKRGTLDACAHEV